MFIMVLILLNVLAIILESVESLGAAYGKYFDFFEYFSVVVFSMEYLMRLITADFKYRDLKGARPFFRYIFSTLALIDLMAILPSLLIWIAPLYSPLSRLVDLRFIRMLRIMRLFRIFKISRYSDSLRMIGAILKEKKRDLAVTIFITLILLVISSTLMYYAEHDAQAEQFPNIVATFWWAVATLTTVGYGDVFPITPLGKILSGIIALLGIGMVALPTGILSSAFIEMMDRKKAKGEEKEEAIEHAEIASHFKYCPHCGEKLVQENENVRT